MSVRIRIELRREGGIFTSKEADRERLLRYVASALESLDPRTVTGPFADGEVTVYQIELEDPRRQWTAAKPSTRTSSTDFD